MGPMKRKLTGSGPSPGKLLESERSLLITLGGRGQRVNIDAKTEEKKIGEQIPVAICPQSGLQHF